MKLELNNLSMLVQGREMNLYQRNLAIAEFQSVIEFLQKLESEKKAMFDNIKASKIFKDLKEGKLSLELAEQQVLSLFAFNNWVACDERLPDNLQTVWLINKEKQWVALGCLVDTNEGWHWAETNGTIYIENAKIVSECESDDLDVTHWCALPDPPCY